MYRAQIHPQVRILYLIDAGRSGENRSVKIKNEWYNMQDASELLTQKLGVTLLLTNSTSYFLACS